MQNPNIYVGLHKRNNQSDRNNAKDLSNLLIAFLMVSILVLQFWILSHVCQRVTTASERLFDATYNCEWYKQDKKFRKMLIVVREMAKQNMTFGVFMTSFGHQTFSEARIKFQ